MKSLILTFVLLFAFVSFTSGEELEVITGDNEVKVINEVKIKRIWPESREEILTLDQLNNKIGTIEIQLQQLEKERTVLIELRDRVRIEAEKVKLKIKAEIKPIPIPK